MKYRRRWCFQGLEKEIGKGGKRIDEIATQLVDCGYPRCVLLRSRIGQENKIHSKMVHDGDGGAYDALEALDYALWRRGVIHSRRYSYLKHGYLDEEPTIIADHNFKSRGALGSRHGALFVGYVNELRDLR